MTEDLNKMAEEITKEEGKKKNLSIAQVKEVLKITLRKMKEMTFDQVAKLLKRSK